MTVRRVRNTFGAIGIVAGIALWIATATEAGEGLEWHGVPYGVGVLLVGIALWWETPRVAARKRLKRELRQMNDLTGPTRPGKARVLSLEATKWKSGGQPVARLTLEVTDAIRTYTLETAEQIPYACLPRVEVGVELPLLISEIDDQQVQIDWSRWGE